VTVRLTVNAACEKISGRLLYRARDRAFHFVPASPGELSERTGGRGTASIGIDTLQLEFGIESGLVLYPWGYWPKESWAYGAVKVPDTQSGGLLIAASAPILPGVAVQVADSGEWKSVYDSSNGWLQLDSRYVEHGAEPRTCIMFADGCVAAVAGGRVDALWLRPEMDISA